ncbi:MAG: protein kinase [Myxococcales bacterium]|nr:protein kinase [Myxococcales bacterium]
MHAPTKSNFVGSLIGRYRVTRAIGHGGIGAVYEAVQEAIGYRAAVKILGAQLTNDPRQKQYVDRFLDEARAVNLINHPGVVRVFDFGETDDHIVYILMEYLDGQTLSSRLADGASGKGKKLTVLQAMRLVRQVAAAMAQAHEKSVIHRDLKPENIILVSDSDVPGGERVKILDFGLARFLDSPERRTTAGVALGTPMYMSPEQCYGGDLDGKSDVYSLGAIAFEMLCGQPPFNDPKPARLMTKHVNEAPPQLGSLNPALPKEVTELVHQLLAKQAAQRPDMRKLVASIDGLEQAGKLPGAELATEKRPAVSASEAYAPTMAVGSLSKKGKGAATSLLAQRPALPWIIAPLALGLLVGVGVAAMALANRTPPPLECPQVVPPVPTDKSTASDPAGADVNKGKSEVAADPDPAKKSGEPAAPATPAKGKGKGKGKASKKTK